jgi:hypothetical protein
MSEQEQEGKRQAGEDELLEEQAGKGYGEDEGERDDALEQQDSERL